MLGLAVLNGCQSFQTVPLEDVESKPKEFLKKEAKVHFAGTAAPDSVVWLRITRIDYPVIDGRGRSHPTLYPEAPAPDTVSVNLLHIRELQVRQFHAGYTALCLAGVSLVVQLLYELTRNSWE
jgi:hypothetical protein